MLRVAIVVLALVALGSGEELHLGFRASEWLKKEHSPNVRIVGGEDAAQGEFPYQVSLRIGLLFKKHFCGGSIISENVILTAAHCVAGLFAPPATSVEVAAGMHHIKNANPNVQKSNVQKAIVHPKYHGGVSPYDIALLVLEKPFKFNKFVQPVALPRQGEEHKGNATLSGWGSISNVTLPKLPEVLQKAVVPLIDFEQCREKLENSPLDEFSNICTGPIGGQLSACSGDSGGPLVQKVENKSTVIGIVSWGMVPCGHGYPTVYTKVSSFVDFIDTSMKA